MPSSEQPTIDADELPDGWEIEGSAGPYYLLVNRDAVEVENLIGDPYLRDVVVIVNYGNDRVGVVKGPAARCSWPTREPEAAALRIVDELQAWIDAGNDPYGRPDLEDRLADVVVDDGGQATFEEVA